ncbi:free fatty acid receptor 3 [Myxocyprinus asiaticus]|uniref:free fatty acid receptor 3 n=1 Tax=Myxocyprinus asiaticus TaxID=70543 RepID=UPI0022229691|nr:free fatty acid receptor 3 [Myxocyprinus asiaticus]
MSNNYTDSPTTVFLTIYIITFLIGFPHTTLAFCTSIRKIHNKPIPMTFFMLNLAVSDLIFLTFLPVKMKEAADNMVWNMPYSLCHFNLFMFFLPIYSSSLFLAAISAERYVCVTFPVKYKSPRRITYTILICVFIWVLVIVTTVFAYKAAYTDSDEVDNTTNQGPLVTEPQQCFFNFTGKQLKDLLKMRLVAVVLFFCAPLIICCFCYISVIRILSKLPLIRRCRRLRAIGLALGTLLVFAICFAPFSVSHLVGYVRQENPKWRMKALMLSTLNACFDPIIFFCISSEMRMAIKDCMKGIFRFYTYIKRFLLLLLYA